MSEDGRFSKMIDRLPVDNDKLIGQAVGWFISKQDPESVEFTKYENGWEIKVFTDSGAADQAREFWEEYVQPHLGGD